jgi:hypothetical protein
MVGSWLPIFIWLPGCAEAAPHPGRHYIGFERCQTYAEQSRLRLHVLSLESASQTA